MKSAHAIVAQLLWVALVGMPEGATAGNCVINNGVQVGDCSNVHVGSKPFTIAKGGTYSGVYSSVVVQPGVSATIAGVADHVVVHRGAVLYVSGVVRHLEVMGSTEVAGSVDSLMVEAGATATVQGVVVRTGGPGRVLKRRGAIVDGVEFK
jgi:hypothetical protein